MHSDMQLWTEVRHALFVEGISKREAVRRFGLNFRTISKIAAQEQPGEYERESAYFFKHHFCRVRQPQEKGHVENAVDYLRHNFMVPMPEFPDFRSFNEHLEQKCRDEFSKTSKMQTKTIGELFSEERSALLPLPDTDFEARRTERHTANSWSLIRFDRNDYSVPSQHAYKEFEVIGGIDTVRFVVDGEVVAEHERDWGVKGTHYNPLHYLAALRKRPNSLDFGAPFADRARRTWPRPWA
jgi:hypothetical protein